MLHLRIVRHIGLRDVGGMRELERHVELMRLRLREQGAAAQRRINRQATATVAAQALASGL